MKKFVPGPWETDGNAIYKRVPHPNSKGFNDYCICVTDSGDYAPNVSWANAHLIAAAPKMLEALERVAHSYRMILGPVWDSSYPGNIVNDAIKKARGDK